MTNSRRQSIYLFFTILSMSLVTINMILGSYIQFSDKTNYMLFIVRLVLQCSAIAFLQLTIMSERKKISYCIFDLILYIQLIIFMAFELITWIFLDHEISKDTISLGFSAVYIILMISNIKKERETQYSCVFTSSFMLLWYIAFFILKALEIVDLSAISNWLPKAIFWLILLPAVVFRIIQAFKKVNGKTKIN